ncbi:MAG: hypothetical protein HY257_01185, partial [Chloroflexi bacterium]|nr:hypothetical protein [Chloroflexota bacterium]
RAGAWFGFTLFIFALTILWYNAARYGNPFNSGYRADETFDNPILLGIYGLLFSPGKGLFVYIPFLAALPVAFALFFRRARAEAFLIIALVTFYVLLFSAWYYWWGGTNWGPRFLIPILPFLILMLAPVVELALNVSAREKMQKIFAHIFFALCLGAFAIELLGVSIPSLAYRTRLLRLTPTPDMDAIFLPSASPLVGAWQLFKPSALDFGWLRVLDGNVSVDWLIIALTVAFIVICITSLRGVLRFAQDKLDATKQSPSYLEIASHRTLAMTLIAIALTFFSLAHYRDAALDRDAGYRALVQLLARAASAREVLIVNDDARAPFFLNENRARLRWYGLSRDPAQWDDATRALLARLARAYPRIWFAYDDAADAPDPTRAWLDAARIALAQYDFEDGVHLILYAPR